MLNQFIGRKILLHVGLGLSWQRVRAIHGGISCRQEVW